MLLLLGCAPELTPWEMEQLEQFRLPEAPEVDDASADFGLSLFYDCGLSGPLSADNPLGDEGETGKIACASCHDPLEGGADLDGVALSYGVGGQLSRNAPTILNGAHREHYGWAGKVDTMWEQIQLPLTGKPHGMEKPRRIVFVRQIYKRFFNIY